jgi:cell division protein FtsA
VGRVTQKSEIIVGLDLGTSKICAVVGELTAAGGIDILGVGVHPSKGLRKGVVVNIDATVAAIGAAMREAEMMSGCEVDHVYAGIAGGHIQGFNSHGQVTLRDGEVGQGDIARVIEAARGVAIPSEREIIHIFPQEYLVDAQDGIREPLGMTGTSLEARVHIVTGAVTSAQNIIKCALQSGLQVADIVLEPLASSEAVLSADEKALGVVLIDIGGGTTDVAIWKDGVVVHTSVLALGGDHLTQDIAIGLRTPIDEAERVKRAHGLCMVALIDNAVSFEVSGIGGRAPSQVTESQLVEIIEPRVDEIFALVRQEIKRTGFANVLASGAVITGGTTLLTGMPELAESILGLPVRRGVPVGIGGLAEAVANPMYATGVGLVQYGRAHEHRRRFKIREKNIYSRVKSRMRSWLGEIF